MQRTAQRPPERCEPTYTYSQARAAALLWRPHGQDGAEQRPPHLSLQITILTTKEVRQALTSFNFHAIARPFPLLRCCKLGHCVEYGKGKKISSNPHSSFSCATFTPRLQPGPHRGEVRQAKAALNCYRFIFRAGSRHTRPPINAGITASRCRLSRGSVKRK